MDGHQNITRVFLTKMASLSDTLKLGSLSVPSRIFMVTRPRVVNFFYTVTFNLASTPSRDEST